MVPGADKQGPALTDILQLDPLPVGGDSTREEYLTGRFAKMTVSSNEIE